MKRIYSLSLIFVGIIVCYIHVLHAIENQNEPAKSASIAKKKIAVFTDYEADDSVAIGLLLQYLKNNDVHDSKDFMIGVLLSNQYSKKALAQNLVNLFGYSSNTVYAGTGGIKEPFEEEGQNILSKKALEEFLVLDKKYLFSNDSKLYQDDESALYFRKMLEDAAPNYIDVILLTNPIDFMKAIGNNIEDWYKINTIYMMGGWFGVTPSFNWNLHIESVIALFEMIDKMKDHQYCPTMIIFSSHFFAKEFNGYVNQNKFPEVIHAFDRNLDPIVAHFRCMVKNWDNSMTVIKDNHSDDQKKWRLEMIDRIGKENIGRQFAPADPATMLGYLYPEKFIIKKKPSKLKFTISLDANERKNTVIECFEETFSNIYIVEKVDLSFFNSKLVELMNISL